MSALRKIIKEAKAATGASLSDLTVLSPQTDPYRIDTPVSHISGKWFAEQMARLGLLDKKLHLRGIHYAFLGSTSLPDGSPYTNTGENWEWLQLEAAKSARWLRYLPFDSIVDARNAAPVIRLHEPRKLESYLRIDPDIILPDIEDLEPKIGINGFEGRQPYRLAFYGEKVSLQPILGPIADSYNADLYLPTGEITDTQMHLMAKSAADDGRRLIVFTIADFDPSGHQMAISIGRKLQAFKDLLFPGVQYSLYPLALTEAQVREFDLPSTPLKETERRADRWRAAHNGMEQTEIDALATLRPELLRKIVTDAVRLFYDITLSHRVFEARSEWREQAQEALDEQISGTDLEELRSYAESQIESIRAQLQAIETSMQMASEELEVDLPIPVIPEPEIDTDLQGSPLISSDWSWIDQTGALIARKRYTSSGGAS